MDKKRVLGAVFSVALKGKRGTASEIARQGGMEAEAVRAELPRLLKEGLVRKEGAKTVLTAKGRKAIKVVFIGGGFEVIHKGHLYTIRKAKGLGDVLVVSVARDSTIRRRKKREPVADESERVEMISSVREVDAAILGVAGDIYVTLERVAPDIVALGYDQYHLEKEVGSEARRRGMKLKVVRLDSPFPRLKTSLLIHET